jgi:signal transduction histidine kinase
VESSLSAAGRISYRLGPLRWAVGVFYLSVGMMLLVSPHQFSSLAYIALQPYLAIWGASFLFLGMVLVAVAVKALPRNIRATAHLVGGAGFLIVAVDLMPDRGWPSILNLGLMGIGVALSAFVAERPAESTDAKTVDLLPLICGAGAALTGISTLALPEAYENRIIASSWPGLGALGLALLVGGAASVIAQLSSTANRAGFASAHLLLGGALIVFAVVSAVPLRAWISLAYYGGFGLVVALVPWLGTRLESIDLSSIHTRLALAFALATGLPLIVVGTIITSQQERAVTSQALAQQAQLAAVVARGVEDYIGITSASVAQVAARPGLLETSAERQRANLSSVTTLNSEILAVALLDSTGNPIEIVTAAPPTRIEDGSTMDGSSDAGSIDPRSLEADLRLAPTSAPGVAISPAGQQLIFAVSAPVVSSSGRVDGVVVAALAPGRLSSLLAQAVDGPGATVTLVDGRGRRLATATEVETGPLADLSSSAPIAATLSTELGGRGQLAYTGAGGERLAGFARLASPDWGLIVDSPEAVVLADVRAQRETASALLLASLVVSLLAGSFAADRLTRPLSVLADAMDSFSSGDESVPLPKSSVSQVMRLAGAFSRMRDRIIVQSDEREQLLTAEQSARAEAEAAVKVRDEFIAVAAHELKTPVTSIQGFAQVLQLEQSRRGQVDPNHLARAMARIDQQSKHLTALTNQLLNVTRLQSGRIELTPEKVDLRALVGGVVAAERLSNPGREIRLTDGEPTRVRVDPLRIEQVMTNLVDNALKFSPAGEPVEVSIDASDPEWVRVSVRDHGIGIPSEKLGRVFERFYQAHPERHYGGMGIGLFISRQFVEMHGGKIWPEQPEGLGIRFVVSLPRWHGSTISTGAGDGVE